MRGFDGCDIECHFYNTAESAVANSLMALEAGAIHIDTSVLGIGERVGIPALGAFLARMLTIDRDHVLSKYKLTKVKPLEDLVATADKVSIRHKAGIRTKAILANSATYEAIGPWHFSKQHYLNFASRVTGRNPIKSKSERLGLNMTDKDIEECTVHIKVMSRVRKLT